VDKMSFFTLIAISFPEVVIILVLGFTLGGVKVPLRKIIFIALLQTFFSYMIRFLPFVFGLHSLIQIAFFMILVFIFTRLPSRSVITSMLLSLSLYLVVEVSVLNVLKNVFHLPLKEGLVDPAKRVIYFIPQFLIIVLILVVLKVTKFKLLNLSESRWDYE